MLISDYCNSNIVSTFADTNLQEAAELMRNHCVGCVIIIDRSNRPIGILTDRDIAVRAVASDSFNQNETVQKYMSRDITVFPKVGTLEDAIRTMSDRAVRRLPIVEADGKICGLLSSDDLIQDLAKAIESLSALYFAQTGTVQRHRSHEYTQMA